jgi:REP element-mobilizing transposase RayT
MGHTYTQILFHIIFSTKNRIPYLRSEIRNRVLMYMTGTARATGASDVLINGPADHVHIFLRVPPALAVAEVVNKIKCNSSKWAHDKRLLPRAFGWQTGYAAFSVSPSNADGVMRYIQGQELHHRKISFQEEYLRFLEKHGVEYDRKHIWG